MGLGFWPCIRRGLFRGIGLVFFVETLVVGVEG